MKKTAVVIGAGIGGMCTAARLAKLGYSVTVLEKETQVGGRANRMTQDGFTFDTGPTLLMMTEVLEETFGFCGKKLTDYLTLHQLEPNYRVIFGDHSQIEVSSNLPRFTAELSRIDAQAPEQFYRYFSDIAEFYRIARRNFIDRNFNKITDFISPRHGYKLWRKRGLTKLWDFTGRYFSDERLRQLFSFQSMYLGVSPYEAPAIYSTVSYMETGLGIWYPKGGMYSLSLALQKLCKDLGVTIKTSSPVKEILVENKTAIGVRLNKSVVRADIVIANADLVYTYKNLIDSNLRPHMPNQKLVSFRQASSALLFYFGIDHDLPELLHHNVILSRKFKQNLDEIFHQKVMPSDPSFYVYVPTKTDSSLAPKGKQVVYVLVPVPNLEAKVDWDKAKQKIKAQVTKRFQKEFKIDLTKHIVTEASFSPQDFEDKYNLFDGSAFGLSHTFFQTGYFRPPNFSRDITNLYFVGASTYPGGGIPMVTLSAKLVVERIQNEFRK